MTVASETRQPATWADYVALARPDHWVKHVFILPGIALAMLLRPQPWTELLPRIAVGLLSACLLASANYVLNEWLDARTDRHHHSKSARPAVAKRLSPVVVRLEYLLLAAVGLGLAWWISEQYLVVSALFLLSGLIYNVPPIRTKELPFLDVVSEAVNNPIRLTLGWVMVDPSTLPPGSLLMAYWMGGAFLMALKRLAEYRSAEQGGRLEALAVYRGSFRHYTEESLLLSSFLYALLAAFFLAVFLVKYRIEYLLTLPIFAVLFVMYLHVALKEDSTVQAPEKLFRERPLVLTVIVLTLTLVVLTWIDIPILERLTSPHFIRIGSD
jgi:4-hydroxybenzoate polyprenyltransferase